MRIVLITLLILIPLVSVADGIKKWIGEDGSVHFGNAPPPASGSTHVGAFEEGVKAAKRGHFKKAYSAWKPLAEQGNARAQYNIGILYYNGQGVPKSYINAAQWYRKAAEQGDAAAQYNLGGMYYKGIGVQQDLFMAQEWLGLAATTGYADAAGWRDLVAGEIAAAHIDQEQKKPQASFLETIKDNEVNWFDVDICYKYSPQEKMLACLKELQSKTSLSDTEFLNLLRDLRMEQDKVLAEQEAEEVREKKEAERKEKERKKAEAYYIPRSPSVSKPSYSSHIPTDCDRADARYKRAMQKYDSLPQNERTAEMRFNIGAIAYDADKKCGDL